MCLNSHSCLQKRASLTGKLLGCKISSCPCEDGAPVSKLATHSSATSLQTFHCLFYLTSLTSEDYLESGTSFTCFLKVFILCFSADTEMKNWKLEGRKSEAASEVQMPVQAGSLWSLWYRIRITHIYSTWIIFTANNRFSCTNCLYILIKSFELFFGFFMFVSFFL